MNIFRMKKILLSWTTIIFLFMLCLSQVGHAEEATATFPAELTGEQLYEQGLNLCGQEKYREATPYFEEAGKRKSNFAEAYYHLGMCYLKTKQFDRSKQSLTFAKVLTQSENLKNKATALIAKIPEEIEKEENKKKDEEKARLDEERRKKQESEQEEISSKPIPEDSPEDSGREIKRTYYPGNRIQSEISYAVGTEIKDGPFKRYHANGQTEEQGYYKNGMKQDAFRTFAQNGDLVSEDNYKNDVLDGKYRRYRGEFLSEEGLYRKGMKNGTFKYYTAGKLRKETHYNDDMKNGNTKRYFLTTGKLKEGLWYKNDVQDGTQNRYNSNGIKVFESFFRDGLQIRERQCRYIAPSTNFPNKYQWVWGKWSDE